MPPEDLLGMLKQRNRQEQVDIDIRNRSTITLYLLFSARCDKRKPGSYSTKVDALFDVVSTSKSHSKLCRHCTVQVLFNSFVTKVGK